MTVSVVIPSYNGSRFIEQAIQSVLHQQRQPEEILVSDDNSSDDTLEICGRYRDHIRIYSNPSGPSGFVNGWNNAIDRAKGDYISILHQDDVLAPEFLRVGMAQLEKHSTVRHLFSTCRYIDANGDMLSASYTGIFSGGNLVKLTGADYVCCYQRLGHPHIHRCPGVITHRSIFDQCRYEAAAGHLADDDFFYRVGMYTDVIGILTPLASFRLHEGSVTGALRDEDLVERMVDDYIYQCRQWKGHPFLNDAAYEYFVRSAGRYIRRLIGYGIRRQKPGMVLKGIKRWNNLRRIRQL